MARDPQPPPIPTRATTPPGKVRKFPFRLWAYALLMTAGAGGLGYYAWTLREQRTKDDVAARACKAALAPAQDDARVRGEQLATCQGQLADITARHKANDEALAKLESNLSATREELTALRAQKVEAEKRMAAITEIQTQFARMIDTGQLTVSARRGSLVVELPAEVLFPSGSAELSEKGQLAVLEVGLILKRFADRRFLVIGHTDNVPLKGSTYADNLELSTARALTVTRFLVKAGMKPDALLPSGAGEHDPVASNTSGADRQRNRRIEIALLPAITELPPLPASLEKATGTPAPN
ncbi:MAG TPA: flagellar motor protein MotB [Kofleriaceae bacterium]|nr:flagellar motor protein MotB [Kofleriaceae bacterium]